MRRNHRPNSAAMSPVAFIAERDAGVPDRV
jgi:hypothetical protein